jgi:signal transduction histidine kinase
MSLPALDKPPKRATLLVCDDEDGPRQSLRIVFKDEYDVLLADSGPKAIELAEAHQVDAAVLDIRMAGMSGIEVLNRLKELDPSTEVIMLTAYETIETARQALRLGACDYLNKPFNIAQMRKAVANAMDRRANSNQIRENNQKLRELQSELDAQKVNDEMNRTRGEIYASIIHDINGPLTIISGFLDIINQHMGSGPNVSPEDLDIIKDRLARITRQVTNCIEISRRYLGFLREHSTAKGSVGANQILTDLWELLKFHPSLKKHHLNIKPLAEDVQVQINGTDLIQILLNLSINAFQAIPTEHTVQVFGEILRQPLDLKQFNDGPEERFINREGLQNEAPLLSFSVQDDGPGIPPNIMPKIFETYFTTKGESQGSGLGLSIVQRLVRENKGALHLRSRVGQGTTFTVFLPVQRL